MKKFWQIIACSGLVLTSCLGGMAQAQDEKSDVEYYYQGEKINLDKAVSISQNYDVVFFDESFEVVCTNTCYQNISTFFFNAESE